MSETPEVRIRLGGSMVTVIAERDPDSVAAEAMRDDERTIPPMLAVVMLVPVPVSWTSGRLRHQAALWLNFSRARAGVMYPCR